VSAFAKWESKACDLRDETCNGKENGMNELREPIDIRGEARGTLMVALDNAEAGDRIIYHVGEHCGGSHRRDAARAAQDGLCMLFCKRVGEGLFAYVAIKRKARERGWEMGAKNGAER
jgi:hypothetical protein